MDRRRQKEAHPGAVALASDEVVMAARTFPLVPSRLSEDSFWLREELLPRRAAPRFIPWRMCKGVHLVHTARQGEETSLPGQAPVPPELASALSTQTFDEGRLLLAVHLHAETDELKSCEAREFLRGGGAHACPFAW